MREQNKYFSRSYRLSQGHIICTTESYKKDQSWLRTVVMECLPSDGFRYIIYNPLCFVSPQNLSPVKKQLLPEHLRFCWQHELPSQSASSPHPVTKKNRNHSVATTSASELRGQNQSVVKSMIYIYQQAAAWVVAGFLTPMSMRVTARNHSS